MQAKTEVKEHAKSLFERGFNAGQIARELKVSPSTAWTWCRTFKPGNIINDPVYETVRDLYKEGLGHKEISKRLGLTATTVYGWVTDLIDRNKKVKKVLTPRQTEQRKKEAQDLYKQDFTYVEIATKLGVSKTTAVAYCRDLAKAKREERGSMRATISRKIRDGVYKRAEHPYSHCYFFEYTRHDGQRCVQLKNKDTLVTRNMTLIRYLKSVEQGRILGKNEKVTFISGNKVSLDNIKITVIGEGNKAVRHPVKRAPKICEICDKTFIPTSNATKTCGRVCGKALKARSRDKHYTVTCTVCQCEFHSHSLSAKTCSKTCKDAKRNARYASRKDHTGKIHKPKIYVCDCVICEEPFSSKTKNAEVCDKPECHAVLEEGHAHGGSWSPSDME